MKSDPRMTDGAARAGLLRAALKHEGVLALQTVDGDGAIVHCAGGHVDLERQELQLNSTLSPFEPFEVVRGTFEQGGGSYQFLSAVKSVDPLVIRLPASIEGAHRRSSARWIPGPLTCQKTSRFISPGS